jgi:hypothetical protein
MLGLAFQGQGQLDMAFDKFRKCPMDDAVMENLYNLALDFERKRQFNKAESVFRYMADFNPEVPRPGNPKLTRAKAMSETVMLGGGGDRRRKGTMILEGGQVEKPMLGRYQVEKELGKGAMGVVYLGRDPKINRVVAIKTMALSQEFEEDELKDVKERFFREAETAGRLNHPNIVTIFDAGEEHDLAYIAMEFLKGKDLVPYTKPGQPAAAAKVMEHRRARRRGARLRPPEQRRAPRHQAGQHHVRARIRRRSRSPTSASRASPIPRRPRPAWCSARRATCRPSSSPARRSTAAVRPVLAGRDAVPDGVRQAALRGRFDGAADVQDRQRAASGHPRRSTRRCRTAWRRSSIGAGQGRQRRSATRPAPRWRRTCVPAPEHGRRRRLTQVDFSI